MDYHLCKDVMEDAGRRTSFNELAIKVFGLSFETWYRQGFWSDRYIPYTLFHGDQAVANVSVNKMEVRYKGKIRNYIQLGTVMTDSSYRKKGLSRYILEEVLRDWEASCDSMFLFANNNVLDFYPKFGFEKELQYQFAMNAIGLCNMWRKLDVNHIPDQELLMRCYRKANPFSRIQVVNHYGLLMFYAMSAMKDCIYYSLQYDAVVIAVQKEGTLDCYDVFCHKEVNVIEMLTSMADIGTRRILLEFTPEDTENFDITPLDGNETTLFVLKGKENIFKDEKMLFPSISHT